MAVRKQLTHPPVREEDEEIVPPTPKSKTDTLKAVDDILDEIDDILEENAEHFVKSYVQKGGQ